MSIIPNQHQHLNQVLEAKQETYYQFVRTNSDDVLKSSFERKYDPLTNVAVKIATTDRVGIRSLPGKDTQGQPRTIAIPLVHIVAVLDEGTEEEEEVIVYSDRFKDDAERLLRTVKCEQTDEYILNIKHKFHDRLWQLWMAADEIGTFPAIDTKSEAVEN